VLELLVALALALAHNFEDIELTPALEVVASLFDVVTDHVVLGCVWLQSLDKAVHAFVNVVHRVNLFLSVQGAEQDARTIFYVDEEIGFLLQLLELIGVCNWSDFPVLLLFHGNQLVEL